MDGIQVPTLTLKRPINLKVIVTPRWKDEVQQQLQGQIANFDGQLQQLDVQGNRTISELQQQGNNPQLAQQIENIQLQVNQKKREILEKKNQVLQQLQQVQNLELDQEFFQGQIDGFADVKVGDNLVRKLNVDVVVRDGVIEEIRGEI
ncbi:MAG: YlqD family protein [Synechococcus sp.]|nr:YlqD family protein [Synechococcus sp.]